MSDHQNCLKKFDVIVIGSGISGLTTALIMAKEGKKVALLERDRELAPLLRPYTRKNCMFSPGLHFSGWIGEDGSMQQFLGRLGVADGVKMVPCESGLGDIILGNYKYHIDKTLERTAQEWERIFPESIEAIRFYVQRLKEINSENKIFRNDMTLLHDVSAQSNIMTALTLSEVLEKHHASKKFIELVGALNLLLIGSNADEVPFEVHADVAGGFYELPGRIPFSGMVRLLANFRRELQRYGVAIHCNSEVTEITLDEQRKVSGILTAGGEHFAAPIVVASYNPKLLLQQLPYEAWRPIYRERLLNAENTFALYGLFYELPQECGEISNRFCVHDDAIFSMIVTEDTADGTAKRVLCCFASVAITETPLSAEQKATVAAAQKQFMEKTVAENFPDVYEKLVVLDFLKPWSFERYTKTIGGSAYGLKQTVNSLRFQHRVPISGLYLVGQAIYPGFFGSMVSAFSLAIESFGISCFWENDSDKPNS